MAVQYRTKGFVFKKENVREADQLFSVFTENFGRVKILGRAVRKIKSKLRSGIDLFYFSEIEFIQGRSYKTLTDAVALNKFKNIRNDLNKLEIVQRIAESTDQLIKGEEKDERIFNLLNESLDELCKNLNCELLYYYFFWSLIFILGYQIDLRSCVECKEKLVPNIMNFSAESQGIICLKCSDDSIKDKIKISPETVKILRIIQKEGWDYLKRLKVRDSYLEELNQISESYLKTLLQQIGCGK